jgi:hypothetical protein
MKRWRKFELNLITCLGVCVLTGCAATTRPPVLTATKEQQFLSTLHLLVKDSPMTAEKISAAFGWKIKQRLVAPAGAYTHTEFDANLARNWGNPNFTSGKNLNERVFSLQFGSDYLCIHSKDVITEFGKTYQSTMLNVETYPDPNTLSEEVKQNQKLFFFGPKYQFKNNLENTAINFTFIFSECLTNLSVIQN